MGANYCTLQFDGNLSKDEVKDRFDDAVAQSLHMDGHSYSGEIGMATGLEFSGRVFPSLEEAEDRIHDIAEKWGPAVAARYTDVNGKEWWFIGAICSS